MKTMIKYLTIGFVAATLSTNANASYEAENFYYTKAKVVNVEPVYHYRKQAYKVHNCELNHLDKKRYYKKSRHQHKDVAATIVGATIGGTVANQIFKHSDLRGVGTITGAFIGGAIANDIHRDERTYRDKHHKPHRHCKVKYKKVKVLDHYQVTYRYKGNYFTTFTDNYPSKKIKIKVSVEPA